jgi:hypothetical protein
MSGSTRFFTATALSLMGRSPAGRLQAGQHLVEIVAARDLAEALAVERVEMHVEAPQAGAYKRPASARQQHAVGGERQIADARNGRQTPDQHRQIAPHQRLAAGDAELDAQPHGDAREALDLLEAQDLARARRTPRPLRHAVEAADVAAVGDADAQVVVNAAEALASLA